MELVHSENLYKKVEIVVITAGYDELVCSGGLGFSNTV